jgi:site-specific recombinase XerD
MTEVWKKMIRALELHDLSKNTQRAYLAAVSGLATFYRQSPDTMTREMMEDYFLYLKQDKGHAPTPIGAGMTGLRFFYNHVLCQEHLTSKCTFSKQPRELPTVLTQGQIWKIIAILHTWDQQLNAHFHLHCLIPGGAMTGDGKQWKPCTKNYLFNEGDIPKYTGLAHVCLSTIPHSV